MDGDVLVEVLKLFGVGIGAVLAWLSSAQGVKLFRAFLARRRGDIGPGQGVPTVAQLLAQIAALQDARVADTKDQIELIRQIQPLLVNMVAALDDNKEAITELGQTLEALEAFGTRLERLANKLERLERQPRGKGPTS